MGALLLPHFLVTNVKLKSEKNSLIIAVCESDTRLKMAEQQVTVTMKL